MYQSAFFFAEKNIFVLCFSGLYHHLVSLLEPGSCEGEGGGWPRTWRTPEPTSPAESPSWWRGHNAAQVCRDHTAGWQGTSGCPDPPPRSWSRVWQTPATWHVSCYSHGVASGTDAFQHRSRDDEVLYPFIIWSLFDNWRESIYLYALTSRSKGWRTIVKRKLDFRIVRSSWLDFGDITSGSLVLILWW